MGGLFASHEAAVSQEMRRLRAQDYAEGIAQAVGTLHDHYFGDYGCPGYLDTLADNPAALSEEYQKVARLCEPLAEFYRGERCGGSLAEFLRVMRPDKAVEGP